MIRFGSRFLAVLLLWVCGGIAESAQGEGFFQSGRNSYALRDPNAIIARYIDEGAWRPVPGISDREYWTKAATFPGAADLILRAEKEDLPASGDKGSGCPLLHKLSIALPVACLTGKDADVEKVLQLVQQLLNIEDWRSASAREAGNAIDAKSSLTALNLCWARVLLEDRMPQELGRLLDRRLRYEILEPLSQMAGRTRKADPWTNSPSQENIYCVTNCSMLVLLQALEPQSRYDLLRWLLPLSLNYLGGLGGGDGFEAGGSVGWNRGFSAYMDHSLIFYLATGKKLDLMGRKGAMDAADFPEFIQLAPGYYPSIGESDFSEPFDPVLIGYRNMLCGFRPEPPELISPVNAAGNLTRTLLFFVYQPGETGRPRTKIETPCSAFFRRQILLCRPGSFHRCRVRAVFKGGSCREPGGHADVGSFTVLLDGVPMLVDPGAKMPEARCHSVPVPDKTVQRSGSLDGAEVVAQKFFNSISEVGVDLSRVYRSVLGLQKLVRVCTYDRNREGSVTIADKVIFRAPSGYESAAIAEGEIKVTAPGEVEITRDGKTLRLTADAGKFPVETELIPLENAAGRPLVRIAFRLKEPAQNFTFRLKATPAEAR